ncbi:MAG: hypothetical protein QME77_09470 [bacterium]|nr:hypothetical protein [bacterium]
MNWLFPERLVRWIDRASADLGLVCLTAKSPGSRMALACVLAVVAVVALWTAQDMILWAGAPASFGAICVLWWAMCHYELARHRLYLHHRPNVLAVDWEVVPGERVGPFSLGPVDRESAPWLQCAHAVWGLGREVTYIFRHDEGMTVVRCYAPATADLSKKPDPSSDYEITEIRTNNPYMRTSAGLHPGIPLPDAIGLLGVPDGAASLRGGLAEFVYPGVVLCAQKLRVKWLMVTPPEGPKTLRSLV